MASHSRILARNWLPRPSPWQAPLTRPAMSTKLMRAGCTLIDLPISASLSSRASGTETSPTLGSMVQNGKLAAWAAAVRVSALKRVDLPTLGRPTMPILKPMGNAPEFVSLHFVRIGREVNAWRGKAGLSRRALRPISTNILVFSHSVSEASHDPVCLSGHPGRPGGRSLVVVLSRPPYGLVHASDGHKPCHSQGQAAGGVADAENADGQGLGVGRKACSGPAPQGDAVCYQSEASTLGLCAAQWRRAGGRVVIAARNRQECARLCDEPGDAPGRRHTPQCQPDHPAA